LRDRRGAELPPIFLGALGIQSDPRVSSSRTRSFGAPPTPERARVTMAPSVSFN